MDTRAPDWVWLLVTCVGSFGLSFFWLYLWVILPRNLWKVDDPAPTPDPHWPGFDRRRRRGGRDTSWPR